MGAAHRPGAVLFSQLQAVTVRGGPYAACTKDARLLEHPLYRFRLSPGSGKCSVHKKRAYYVQCLHIYEVHCMQTREITDHIHEIIHIYDMKRQIEHSNQYCNN